MIWQTCLFRDPVFPWGWFFSVLQVGASKSAKVVNVPFCQLSRVTHVNRFVLGQRVFRHNWKSGMCACMCVWCSSCCVPSRSEERASLGSEADLLTQDWARLKDQAFSCVCACSFFCPLDTSGSHLTGAFSFKPLQYPVSKIHQLTIPSHLLSVVLLDARILELPPSWGRALWGAGTTFWSRISCLGSLRSSCVL